MFNYLVTLIDVAPTEALMLKVLLVTLHFPHLPVGLKASPCENRIGASSSAPLERSEKLLQWSGSLLHFGETYIEFGGRWEP